MDDEPQVDQLENRIDTLESTIEKMMPSRRDALKMGGAALAGGSLMAGRASADTVDDQVGTIGGPNKEVDLVSEDIDNSNQITTKDLVVTDTATGPFGSDLRGCRVFLSSDQGLTAGSIDKIEFDTKEYDSDNDFDTTTHQYDCPLTGIYLVKAQARFLEPTNDRRLIRIDDASGSAGQGSQTDFKSSSEAFVIQTTTCNQYDQGDKIEALAANLNSTDTLDSGNKFFQSHLEVVFLGSL
jgi:hypothetical protein